MTPPRSPGQIAAGILLIVGGVLGFVIFLVVSLLGFFGAMIHIAPPGMRELRLERGNYTIYWETGSRFVRAPSLGEDLEVTVVSRHESGLIAVASSGAVTTRYSTGSRHGVSVGSFTVPSKAVFAVDVRAAPGRTLPEGRVVVGKSMGALGVLKLIGICVALLALGVGGGVGLLVKKPA